MGPELVPRGPPRASGDENSSAKVQNVRVGSSDINGDGVVDVQDLTAVILNWVGSSAADVNNDGTVDVQDLTAVVLAWGPYGSDGCAVRSSRRRPIRNAND